VCFRSPVHCEQLLTPSTSLSELLYLPLPILPSSSSQSASILLLDGSSSRANADNQDDGMTIGKWEDEEERRFYEDIADLRDFVPKSVLGVDEVKDDKSEDSPEAKSKKEEEEVLRLEAEMKDLAIEAEVDDTDHR
jgi:regulator of nonsense transcripts 2